MFTEYNYYLYALDFHLPLDFIVTTEEPSLYISEARPIHIEWGFMLSINFKTILRTVLNWYDVKGFLSKWLKVDQGKAVTDT